MYFQGSRFSRFSPEKNALAYFVAAAVTKKEKKFLMTLAALLKCRLIERVYYIKSCTVSTLKMKFKVLILICVSGPVQ
jgi:hypothetical protein